MLFFVLVLLLMNLCLTLALFVAWLEEREARRVLEGRVTDLQMRGMRKIPFFATSFPAAMPTKYLS